MTRPSNPRPRQGPERADEGMPQIRIAKRDLEGEVSAVPGNAPRASTASSVALGIALGLSVVMTAGAIYLVVGATSGKSAADPPPETSAEQSGSQNDGDESPPSKESSEDSSGSGEMEEADESDGDSSDDEYDEGSGDGDSDGGGGHSGGGDAGDGADADDGASFPEEPSPPTSNDLEYVSCERDDDYSAGGPGTTIATISCDSPAQIVISASPGGDLIVDGEYVDNEATVCGSWFEIEVQDGDFVYWSEGAC